MDTIDNNTDLDRKELHQMLNAFGLTSSNVSRGCNYRLTKLENGRLDKMIRDYFNKSKEEENIFAINIWQVSDTNRFVRFMRKNYYEEDNYMLWHGTKRNNLVSILDNGLRLPLSNWGYFGRGIYFADRVGFSSSFTDRNGNEVILLCQVAVGKIFSTKTMKRFEEPPTDHGSIKWNGICVPDQSGHQRYGNWIFPSGHTIMDTTDGLISGYNQYVVYDPDRVLVKFVVQCSRRLARIEPTFESLISKDSRITPDSYSSMSTPPITPKTPRTPIRPISPIKPDYC